MRATWRGLGWFWAAVLLTLGVGAAVLQALGPLPPPHGPAARRDVALLPAPVPLAKPAAPAPVPPHPPGTIAPPDPALLEQSTTFAAGMLPRIGPGGLLPRTVYAARFAAPPAQPRIAILLGGIGLSEADSEEAIKALPAAVSLAVSPYAYRPERLLDLARATGHEYLLSLPLEPARYPIDDPGNRALLTGNPAALNHQRLEWAMTRFTGYVGTTGALNGMRGERFAAADALMHPLLQALQARGLLYVDPRPGAPPPPFVVGRSADVVIDAVPVRTAIEAALARLEEVARDRGAALGLVGLPRPVTLDRLAAWTATLAQRGLALAPVSAIVQPPPAPPAAPARADAQE
ncbi:MAG: divergent polysaccharide deacetylase family protein [Rhodospirillales bacterium]|nr:divergent polysaccharide deacetylase family protein [Rhodospirillales bacterium]